MPLQQARLYGETVHLIPKDESTIPAITTSEGDSEEVIIDNAFPVQLYHRVVSESPTTIGGTGNDENEIDITTNMVCVVTNNRERTNIKPEDLALGIIAGFITKPEISSIGVDDVTIEVTGTDLDKSNVASGEYVSIKDLPPSYDLFSIAYNIIISVDTRCYNLC